MTKAVYRRNGLWGFRSLRVLTSTVRNLAAGNHGARAVAKSAHLDPQAQDRQTESPLMGIAVVFETSEPIPVTHLQQGYKSCQPVGTFSFKPPQIFVFFFF